MIRRPRRLVATAVAALLLTAAALPASVRAAVPTCFNLTPTIVGTNASETVVGTSGSDVIVGLGGNDEIIGGGGNDFICGNAGDDDLFGQGGRDALNGGADDDVVVGGGTGDFIYGGSGNDSLFGEAGSDRYDGGGGGADYVGFIDAPGPVTADIREGTATGEGSDTLARVEGLIGSSFDDVLFGDARVNFLIGGDGDDTLHGRGESDFVLFIYAGGGIDLDLEAEGANGEGTDTILRIENAYGSSHDDMLRGTPEPNYLDGQEGTDTIDGGGGGDACIGEVVSNCDGAATTASAEAGIRAASRSRDALAR